MLLCLLVALDQLQELYSLMMHIKATFVEDNFYEGSNYLPQLNLFICYVCVSAKIHSGWFTLATPQLLYYFAVDLAELCTKQRGSSLFDKSANFVLLNCTCNCIPL
jgi:hypothetical protein